MQLAVKLGGKVLQFLYRLRALLLARLHPIPIAFVAQKQFDDYGKHGFLRLSVVVCKPLGGVDLSLRN